MDHDHSHGNEPGPNRTIAAAVLGLLLALASLGPVAAQAGPLPPLCPEDGEEQQPGEAAPDIEICATIGLDGYDFHHEAPVGWGCTTTETQNSYEVECKPDQRVCGPSDVEVESVSLEDSGAQAVGRAECQNSIARCNTDHGPRIQECDAMAATSNQPPARCVVELSGLILAVDVDCNY